MVYVTSFYSNKLFLIVFRVSIPQVEIVIPHRIPIFRSVTESFGLLQKNFQIFNSFRIKHRLIFARGNFVRASQKFSRLGLNNERQNTLGRLSNNDCDGYQTSLKREVALFQTYSRLFHLVQFVKCWQFYLEMNSNRLYRSSGKEKESRYLVFTSSTKREIRPFHVVVVQRRKRNTKAWCTRRVVFLPFSLTLPSSLLKPSTNSNATGNLWYKGRKRNRVLFFPFFLERFRKGGPLYYFWYSPKVWSMILR